MTTDHLASALTFVAQRENAQDTIETILAPALQDYLNFLPKRGSHWTPHYKNSDEYTFKELDGENFTFVGEEHYEYGETEIPYIDLPFEFVENPAAFKSRILEEIRRSEQTRLSRIKASEEEKVESLKKQLARAQERLNKAQAEEDEIKITSTTNQIHDIKETLTQ